MKLEYKFLITAMLAFILAAPIAPAIHQRADLLKVGVGINLHLDLKPEKKPAQLEKPHNIANAPAKPQTAAPVVVTPAVAVVAPVVPETPAATGCEAYRGELAQYDWNVNVALAVMQAESTFAGIPCNPNAENTNDGHTICMGSRGLFQIGCDSTDNYAGMFNASANIAQAHALYARRGWQPWTTYTTGAYLKYL